MADSIKESTGMVSSRSAKLRLASASLAVFAWSVAGQATAGNLDGFSDPVVLERSPSWSGLYFGVHGGRAETSAASIFDEGGAEPHVFFGADKLPEFHGGLQGGYNFSNGPLVFGIEGDYSRATGNNSRRDGDGDLQTLDTEYLATLRGRFGAATDNVLVYLTGGVGFTRTRYQVENGTAELSFDSSGLVYGVGVERKIGRRSTLKAEYLRLMFDKDFPSARHGGPGVIGTLPDGDPSDFLSLAGLGVFRVGVNVALGPQGSSPSALSFADTSGAADFSGFYTGAHVGYQHTATSGIFDSSGAGTPSANFASFDLDSAEGGLQFGYNFQRGDVVYGVEGGYSWFDASDSFVDGSGDLQQLSLDHYATLRGRLGIVASNMLVYGTAGLAYGEIDLVVENGTAGLTLDDVGLAIGGGIEWALTDRFSVKAEYLRINLKAHSGSSGASAIGSLPDGKLDDSLTFHGHDVVRIGAVMHF